MECGMERSFHRGFTTAEKTELWDRWKRGESLKAKSNMTPSPIAKTRKPSATTSFPARAYFGTTCAWLGAYTSPGPRDAMQTVDRLLTVLDTDEVVHAIDRLKRRQTLRLVE